MDDLLTITSVYLDSPDGVLVAFSDCTIAGYVDDELLELRPLREVSPRLPDQNSFGILQNIQMSTLDDTDETARWVGPTVVQVDRMAEGLIVYFKDCRAALLTTETLYSMIDVRSELASESTPEENTYFVGF